MMKRWISMLLALMLLMLGMATAEDASDDAWEYELVGHAIETCAADGCAGARAAV